MRKNVLYFFQIYIFFVFSSCTTNNVTQFEVQRPSRITVPREVKKVFVRQDLINERNDKLGIKSILLTQLAKELNELGRFKVSVINTLDKKYFDPEQETVAIIQGEVISGGEVDHGQFTDIATCTGGISGRLSSAGAASINKEAITFDNWRGYVCRRGSFTSKISELALSSAFALAGINENYPPKNQVVRTYKYKNLSLYAQTNFSFTLIGQKRETLAIRSDSANFGRSIVENNSFHNVKETHMISLTLGSLISFTRIPIFPIPSREVALAELSNPEKTFYSQNQLPLPKSNDFQTNEKNLVIQELVKNTLKSFISTISPYKVRVEAEVATGGNSIIEDFLKKGNSKKAIKIIEAIPPSERESHDWYNLGLAYESSAVSKEDYEDARRFYINALEKSPDTKLYARGIGRCRLYLSETKKLDIQTQK